jgi:hypothetical protein
MAALSAASGVPTAPSGCIACRRCWPCNACTAAGGGPCAHCAGGAGPGGRDAAPLPQQLQAPPPSQPVHRVIAPSAANREAMLASHAAFFFWRVSRALLTPS